MEKYLLIGMALGFLLAIINAFMGFGPRDKVIVLNESIAFGNMMVSGIVLTICWAILLCHWVWHLICWVISILPF